MTDATIQENQKPEDLNELMRVRREKMTAIEAKGIEPFARKYDVTLHACDIINEFEKFEGQSVKLAGRIMAVRGHGKTSFVNLMDMSGRVQIYFRQDAIGEDQYEIFNLLDIGDLIGVEGVVFKTQRGEMSVKVSSFEIMAKSLRPLPEKWHGLKDVETRYRQRYLDLIVHPEVRNTFVTRSKIIKSLRRILDERDYLEVETPMMHPIAGGAAARPFTTHHNALDMNLYMRIAPELYLKRLIVGGFERVYEVGRVFRNEGISIRHNPEFTIVEMYQAYADYQDLMRLTEDVVSGIALEVLGTTQVVYQGQEINFAPPWNRITMPEAVKKYTDVDFDAVQTVEKPESLPTA